VNPDGRALAIALSWGRGDVARALLAAGAKVPADHDSIAVDAVRGKLLDVVVELVARAPKLAKQLASAEAVDAAISTGDPVLLDYVLQHGGKLPDDLLGKAIEAGAVALVEAALRAPGATKKCGRSNGYHDAMCAAAHALHLDIVQLLAKHGVPIHPDKPGDTTPIHRATDTSEAKAVDVVRWFLDNGVSATATTANGRSVLTYACNLCNVEVIRLLIARGADPDDIQRAEMNDDDRWNLLVDLDIDPAPRRLGKAKPKKAKPKPKPKSKPKAKLTKAARPKTRRARG